MGISVLETFVTSFANATTPSFVASIPNQTVSGDTLLLTLVSGNTTTIVGPSDWTNISSQKDTNGWIAISFLKKYSGGDPATATVSLSHSVFCAVAITRLTGVDSLAIGSISAVSSLYQIADASSNPIDCPPINGSWSGDYDNLFVVFGVTTNFVSIASPPAGYTGVGSTLICVSYGVGAAMSAMVTYVVKTSNSDNPGTFAHSSFNYPAITHGIAVKAYTENIRDCRVTGTELYLAN